MTGTDPVPAATVKHDPRMAEVLRRALYARVSTDGVTDLAVPDGSYRWRVSAAELADLVAEVRAEEPPYAVGRERVRTRVVRRLRDQAERRSGVLPASWVRRIERCRPLTEQLDAVWPKVRPEEILAQLLTDAGALARAADGLLDPGEQAALLWTRPPRSFQVGPLVGRRPGPAGRTRRTDRTPRGLRPPRRGRGAGPLPRWSAGPSPAGPRSARSPSSATSPRAPPVGRPRLVRTAAPPRPAGRGRGAADHRVPGAGGRPGAGQPAARPPRRRRTRRHLPAHRRRADPAAHRRPARHHRDRRPRGPRPGGVGRGGHGRQGHRPGTGGAHRGGPRPGRPRRARRPADRRPRERGQGPGVRPRHRRRTGRGGRGGTARSPPPVRGPDPRGLPPGRRPPASAAPSSRPFAGRRRWTILA